MELQVHSDYIIGPWFDPYNVNIGVNRVVLEKREDKYVAKLDIFKPAVVFTVEQPYWQGPAYGRSSRMTHYAQSLTQEFRPLSEGEWEVTGAGKKWLSVKLKTPRGSFDTQLNITSEEGVPSEVIEFYDQLWEKSYRPDPMM